MNCSECGTLVKRSGGEYHCTHCGHNGQFVRIPVIVVGPNGKKLGLPVVSALVESDEFILVGGVTRPNQGAVERITGGDGAVIAGSFAELVRTNCPSDHKSVVVFYAVKADALLPRVKEAVRDGFSIHVIGTTGLSQDEMLELRLMAQNGEHRVMAQASNFSVGANMGAEQCAVLARQFPDADVEIVEAHHNQKADAPSGTALYWARAVAAARGQALDDVVRYGRHGKGKRAQAEICIHALRGGSVTGFHRATFFGPDDEISVEHNARSSALFAKGALRVIKWAPQVALASSVDTSMERRLYHMYDMLGLPILKELGVY